MSEIPLRKLPEGAKAILFGVGLKKSQYFSNRNGEIVSHSSPESSRFAPVSDEKLLDTMVYVLGGDETKSSAAEEPRLTISA